MKNGLTKRILAWYSQNKRNLPWRKTRDPYKILVSEIMLQQTQVSRVVEKYKQFLKLFPTAQALAHAKTADVLKAWAGLGYNRRALFLQKTAQSVVSQYKGKFPKDLELLKELPGIGDYTARAILSFAFGEAVPVLDTNHRKFYQRTYFGNKLVRDEILLTKAQNVILSIVKNPMAKVYLTADLSLRPAKGFVQDDVVYHWNQALMDFMSAVVTTSEDPFILWYQKTYPAPKKKKQIKPAVRFLDTDRYFRGRIIDLLREDEKTTILSLQKKFSHIPKERVIRIVSKLQKDGLILVKNKRILLP